MKLIFSAVLTVCISISATAQIDTVCMTPGYAEQVFYSTATGVQSTAPSLNWDIAFATEGREVGIRTNAINGVTIYKVPTLTIADWAIVDTSGIDLWDKPTNSIEEWMIGAFNRNSLSAFDYGWGVYNPVTHEVNGDSLYVIELSNGAGSSSFKKLMIEKKSAANHYLFKYADLNGSNEVSVDINCANYANENFAYYSIRNGSSLSREPSTDDWNITFTRYIANIPGFGNYPVTGVLSNIDVEVAEASGVNVNTVQPSSYDSSYSSMISEIGDDWKSFNGMGFDVEDSLVYFVKSQDDGISCLRFTGFEGTASGNIFLKTAVLTTSISELPQSALESLAVYPTVVSNDLHVVYSLANNTDLQVRITSVDGRLVDQRKISSAAGLQEKILDVSSYSSGYYILSLISANDQLHSKFIVNK